MAGYKGQQGRKPKPTALKILQGSRRVKANAGEPKPSAASLTPPKWMAREGRKVWRELAPPLHALGLLTELDVEMFAHACALVAVARTLPPGSKDHLRVVAAANKILSGFGFTPSDRASLSVSPVVKDKFADFLDGKEPPPAI